MKLLEKLHHPEKYFVTLFKWGLLGLFVGLLGGLLGAGFHHALHFVTHIRQENGWLILLLPVAGLGTVGLYRLLKLRENRGTNEIIDAVLKDEKLKPQIAPGIFLATSLTHLFGGSAGREGAALQLGGSVASLLGRALRLKENERTVLTMAGMSAVFAGLFGTPLTATVFTMEFVSVGPLFSPALLPCFLSAFTASRVSLALGVHPEGLPLGQLEALTAVTYGQVLLLAVAIGILGIAMCFFFHEAEHLAAKRIPNVWLRIALGGCLIALLTALVGDQAITAPAWIWRSWPWKGRPGGSTSC